MRGRAELGRLAGGRRLTASGHGDRLQLEVAVAGPRGRAPDRSRWPSCPERGRGVHAVGLVDAEGPGPDPPGHGQATVESAVHTEPRGRSRNRRRCGRPRRPCRGCPRAGPKISSRAIRMRLSTSANRVGRTYQPRSMPVGQVRPRRRRVGRPLAARPRCSLAPAPAGARATAARSRSPRSLGSPPGIVSHHRPDRRRTPRSERCGTRTVWATHACRCT